MFFTQQCARLQDFCLQLEDVLLSRLLSWFCGELMAPWKTGINQQLLRMQGQPRVELTSRREDEAFVAVFQTEPRAAQCGVLTN